MIVPGCDTPPDRVNGARLIGASERGRNGVPQSVRVSRVDRVMQVAAPPSADFGFGGCR
jgi:hypothetical protein